MKLVSINLKLNQDTINESINKVREFKELYLLWCIEGSSPADFPEDMLAILRGLENIDKHFVMLYRKIENVKCLEKGEEIIYPDIE